MKIQLAIGDVTEEAFASVERNRDLRRDFGHGNVLVMIFSPSAPQTAFSAADFAAIRAWIERERAGNKELLSVGSPFDLSRLRPAGSGTGSAAVPESATPEWLEAIAASPWNRVLTDFAARDIAAEFVFRDAAAASRYGAFDPTVVGALLSSFGDDAVGLSGRVQIRIHGPAAFQYHALEGIQRFRILNLLILAIVVPLFRVLFGTWRSGLLFIGIIATAGIVVYGAMSFAGHPIDFLSTGLFLMLSVAALADFIFLSAQQLAYGTGWRPTFRQLLVPSFLTSLTTVVGFGSLYIADLAIVQRFGAWAAFGATVEWLVTFLLLPSCIAVFAPRGVWTNSARAWRPGIPTNLIRLSLPRIAIPLLLAVYAFGTFGALRLNTSDTLVGLFPDGHAYRDGFEYLSSSRGWNGQISVVLPDAGRLAGNRDVLLRLSRHPNVAKILDPYTMLDYAVPGLPVTPAQAIAADPTAGAAFRSFLSPDGHARVAVYLMDISLKRMNDTIRFIEDTCRAHGCYPAGDLVAYAEFATSVPATLFKSLVICLCLVGAILLVLIRANGRAPVLRILPAAFWGPAFMMTVLWVFQVPVNFLTCVFASVLVGLTGDNVIQYNVAGHGKRMTTGIERRGAASVQVALVMGLICLVFLGSSFVPSRVLGVLLGVGFIASLIGDLWLLKALLGRRAANGGTLGRPTAAQPDLGVDANSDIDPHSR
jgi:hypothetical protein